MYIKKCTFSLTEEGAQTIIYLHRQHIGSKPLFNSSKNGRGMSLLRNGVDIYIYFYVQSFHSEGGSFFFPYHCFQAQNFLFLK